MVNFLRLIGCCAALTLACSATAGEGGDGPATVAEAHAEYLAAIADAKDAFEHAVNRAYKRYRRRLEAAAERGPAISGGSLASYGIEISAEKPRKQHVPIDWSAIYGRSAGVRVMGAEPVWLTASEESGWERVPPALRKRPALVHSDRENEHNGVADIDVTRDGILLVACNYGYQGNNSGDWDEKRWTKEQFVENGWTLVPDKDLGGVLVKKGGREQVVFMRHVKKGENYRLRCNKYDPPFAIVFP